MEKIMDELIVYKPTNKKMRVGKLHDGGYVIEDLPGNYDILISGGIADDITFEQYFLNHFTGLKCLAFDGTTRLNIDENNLERIQIIKKNLGNVNNDKLTNLHEEIINYNNIFLKMDIEGHEFRIIPTFNKTQMNKFKQIVLEIHTPFDIELHPDYFEGLSDIKNPHLLQLLKKINETHTIIHLHANNGCKMNTINNIPIPHVFEVTFVRNDFVGNKELNDTILPIDLDYRNVDHLPDYKLDFYPYCIEKK